MQGGGGDPFDFGRRLGNFGGSFGGSFGEYGVPSNGPPSPMSSFGGDSIGPNNGPPSQMPDVFGGDSIDGFGRSNGGPPSQMSNVLGGDSANDFGGSNGDLPSLPNFSEEEIHLMTLSSPSLLVVPCFSPACLVLLPGTLLQKFILIH